VEQGTLLAGRYEMLHQLGRGGMGEVWAARDQVLQRQVALKLLPVDGDARADLSARFEREAVAAAQINHPNVVALYDRGVHEGTLFLTMELVDGMPLSALIEASGVLPLARALELAEQICAALEATHQAGVVHLDIKPRPWSTRLPSSSRPSAGMRARTCTRLAVCFSPWLPGTLHSLGIARGRWWAPRSTASPRVSSGCVPDSRLPSPTWWPSCWSVSRRCAHRVRGRCGSGSRSFAPSLVMT
jgi:hypothetical protein